MPFVSKAQEKWAFSTKQPFAKKWAAMTNQKKLPKHVKKRKHKSVYKYKVDNKMRWQGETDLNKKVIKINKKLSKKHSTVIDTIVHEHGHVAHPKMHEKNIRIETKNKLKRMSENKKHKLYNLYK
jgi:hypothetical protein